MAFFSRLAQAAEEFDLTPSRGDDEHVTDAVASLAAAHRLADGIPMACHGGPFRFRRDQWALDP